MLGNGFLIYLLLHREFAIEALSISPVLSTVASALRKKALKMTTHKTVDRNGGVEQMSNLSKKCYEAVG